MRFRPLLAACSAALALLYQTTAAAAPVAATFNGTIDSVSPLQPLRDDFKTGNPFRWSINFDDDFLGLDAAALPAAADRDVTGTARFGPYEFELHRLHLIDFWTDGSPGGAVAGYFFEVLGDGPATDHGGRFDGVSLTWLSDLSLQNTRASWTYASAGGEGGYLIGDGRYSLDVPQPPSTVPSPATAWLVIAGLWWLARRPVRRPRA